MGLSFRVRDGTGRFPHAITTENLSAPVPQRVCGVGGNLFSGLVCVDQYVVIKTPGPTHECGGVGLLVGSRIVDAVFCVFPPVLSQRCWGVGVWCKLSAY